MYAYQKDLVRAAVQLHLANKRLGDEMAMSFPEHSHGDIAELIERLKFIQELQGDFSDKDLNGTLRHIRQMRRERNLSPRSGL